MAKWFFKKVTSKLAINMLCERHVQLKIFGNKAILKPQLWALP